MARGTLVIFDCDGTLVDTEYLSAAATAESLKHFGLSYTPETIHATFIGIACSVMLETMNKRHGTSIGMADFNAIYIPVMSAGIREHMRVLPDSVACVKKLAAQPGVTLCVGSNGHKTIVLETLSAAGYMGSIGLDDIFTASDVARPKPFPDLFLHAAATKGFEPAQCIVVEDSVTGARAGLEAGMTVIGYTGLAHDPAAQGESLKKLGVKRIITTLSDLVVT